MAKKVTFEEALGGLEEIVRRLEDGELPLEECLEQYREGLRLHKVCQDRLGKVEEELSRFLQDDGQLGDSEEDPPGTGELFD